MIDVAPQASSIQRSSNQTEIIIVGGGLAGSLAAILLARSGCGVTLIDLHSVYPPDFRAEQLVGHQVEVLARLGLLDVVVGSLVPVERAVATRAGKTVGRVDAPHYGLPYEDMVKNARRHLPASVHVIEAKVTGMELTASRQRVLLGNGDCVEGRLVILATGLGQRLLRQIGAAKANVGNAHSLTFGFDLDVASASLVGSSVLVAYGDAPADRIDYLTLFSVGHGLRGNLFTYHKPGDPWVKRFMQQPTQTLRQAMPFLERTTGVIDILGTPQLRVNDLAVAADYYRDGVVLIGDAFQTSCPAAGTGIGRLLNDIERLCVAHIPAWLGTDGMDAGKISQFYGDPTKTSFDAEALRVARYRRAVTVETGLSWRLHRQRVALQNRLLAMLSRPTRNADPATPMAAGATPVAAWNGAGMAPTLLPR